MRLLVLNNWDIEFPPDTLAEDFARQGLETDVWWSGGDRLPNSLDGYDALFLSGALAAPWDPAPWIPREVALILEAAGRGLPALGVCFGSQLLAYALCGRETVFRRSVHEANIVQVLAADSFRTDPLGLGVPARFPMLSWHREQVVADHADIHIFAASQDCANQVWRYRGLPVWGVQGHPEAGGSAAWLAAHRDTLVHNGLPAHLATVPALPETPDAMRLFANFAAIVRA